MLCPVRRPITTLDCVLLKDSIQARVTRLGPDISSWVCLCVLQGPRHSARFCFSMRRFIFLLIFCLENPKKGWGPKNRWTEPRLASLMLMCYCPYTIIFFVNWLITCKDTRGRHICILDGQLEAYSCSKRITKQSCVTNCCRANIVSPHNVNGTYFLMEAHCVLRALRMESVYAYGAGLR